MAYCRFSNQSDVYFYESSQGGFVCERCSIYSGTLLTFDDAIAHLQAHIKAGHMVPSNAIEELLSDRNQACEDE